MNRPEYRIHIPADLTRRNPEHEQPPIVHPRIAKSITPHLFPIVMDPPIDLNHELCQRTVEIDGVRPDRMLPSELQASETSSTQLGPQHSLGRSLRLTQFAGALDWIGSSHRSSMTR